MTIKRNFTAIMTMFLYLSVILQPNANAGEANNTTSGTGETAINIEKYEDDDIPEQEESFQIPLAPSPQQESGPIMLDGMDLNRLIPPSNIKKEEPAEVPVPPKEQVQPEKKTVEKKNKPEEPKTVIPRMKNPRHLSDIVISGGYGISSSFYGVGKVSSCSSCGGSTFVNKVRPAMVGRPMNIRSFLKMPGQANSNKTKNGYMEEREYYIKCRADCPPPKNTIPTNIQVLPKNAVLLDYECVSPKIQTFRCKPGSYMKINF